MAKRKGKRKSKKRKKKHRKHTPIVSERQRRFMGAEYSRKKRGKKGRTKMSKAELKRHLKEAKGKKLPETTKRGKKWYASRYKKTKKRRKKA